MILAKDSMTERTHRHGRTHLRLEYRSATVLLHVLLLAAVSLLMIYSEASTALAIGRNDLLPGILATVTAWCYWSWRKATGMLNHPYVWFLTSTVLYNASLIFLRMCGLDSLGFLDAHFGAETLARTTEYLIISFLFLHFGALLAASRRTLTVNALEPPCDNSLSIVGWILFAVSIGPAVLAMRTNLGLVMQGGYFALYQQEWIIGADRIGTELAAFLTPAAVFLLVGNPGSRFIRIFALTATLGQGVAGLFIGSRSAALLPIVAIMWAWHRAVRRINPKAVVAAALGFFLVLSPLIEATRNTAGLSGLRLMTQFEMTQSTEASSTGMCSASPSRNSTLVTPASRAFRRARSTISGVMSIPITLPVAPTFSAAMKQSIPAPEPMSSTTCPGRTASNARGLPQPKECSAASPGRWASSSGV